MDHLPQPVSKPLLSSLHAATDMKLEIRRIAERFLPQLACDRRVFSVVLASSMQEQGNRDCSEVLNRLLV